MSRWFHKYEHRLAWGWILLVAAVLSSWLWYCLSPDKATGIMLVRKALRGPVIQEYRNGLEAAASADYKAAEAHFLKVVRRTEGRTYRNLLGRLRARTLLEIATVYAKSDQAEAAVAALEQAVEADPGNYRVHLIRGQILGSLGENHAEEALLQARRIYPASLEVAASLISYYVSVELYPEAVSVFDEYLGAFRPVFGLVRQGSLVAEISFSADSKMKEIIIPWSGRLDDGASLEIELNNRDVYEITVFFMSAASLQGRPAEVLAREPASYQWQKFPDTVQSLSIDAEVFAAPKYVFTANVPSSAREVDSIVITARAVTPLSADLVADMETTYLGLDDNAALALLREMYVDYKAGEMN